MRARVYLLGGGSVRDVGDQVVLGVWPKVKSTHAGDPLQRPCHLKHNAM